jgi:hypothetical protein
MSEINELANKRMKIIVDRTPDREQHARRIVQKQLRRIEEEDPYIPARDTAVVPDECGECNARVWEPVGAWRYTLCPMHREKRKLENERNDLKRELEVQQLEMEIERLREEKELRGLGNGVAVQ